MNCASVGSRTYRHRVAEMSLGAMCSHVQPRPLFQIGLDEVPERVMEVMKGVKVRDDHSEASPAHVTRVSRCVSLSLFVCI